MSKTTTPALKNETYLPKGEAPLEIKDENKLHTFKRVARPLRHVRYVPTKQLVFYSKNKAPQFTYDIKFKTPIKSNQIVVQVKAVGLNPVDLKIINSYVSNFNAERGIGREYAGVITHVGADHASNWKEGDEVCGLFFHPNGYGTLSSSVLIDPSVDALVKKPKDISMESAGSWLYTFGSAYQILNSVKNLNQASSVLIVGGSSSVGLMVIQLLKVYYKVENIAAIVSGSAIKLVESHGATVAINYKINNDLPHVLELLTKTGVYKDYDQDGKPIDNTVFRAGKFDLIVDCVGGYNVLGKVNKYLKYPNEGGKYITTVGDVKSNYHKDIYNQWNSAYVNTRAMFGGTFGFGVNYTKFEFDRKPDNTWLQLGAELLGNGEITNVIDTIYNWKDFKVAASKLQAGHAHGKIVLQVDDF
ncbi:hypothetical protein WICPIJ_001210 [Wickerhamomyces pijperi]|uniref:Enoyl reductase (ER) domain-containing protein n=1 Tax=Wickerhamomyces pijperi TaxID=599730 RepID=A0A9P8QC08_WICPI|nr:hypothetical protein WICPIJ_001210 [Wickerhamomyces pijperi]